MSHVGIQTLNDLDTIIKDEITLFGNTNSVQEEIYHNMWIIDFDNEFVKTISLKDLVTFLTKLLEQRSLQISQKYPNLKATFYIWYDKQAGQLRVNLLSGDNTRPPFGCTLNIIQSPLPILKKFLSEMQSEHPPLSYENFKMLNPGDPGWDEFDDDDEEDDNSNYIQDVFVITLPQKNISTFLKNLIA